jgi:hypothetical protein
MIFRPTIPLACPLSVHVHSATWCCCRQVTCTGTAGASSLLLWSPSPYTAAGLTSTRCRRKVQQDSRTAQQALEEVQRLKGQLRALDKQHGLQIAHSKSGGLDKEAHVPWHHVGPKTDVRNKNPERIGKVPCPVPAGASAILGLGRGD